jgi:hydrogenase maturation protein HypF
VLFGKATTGVNSAEMPDHDGIPSRHPLATGGGSNSAQILVTPDRVICRACAEEVMSRSRRRFRYPFAQCGHCGPRYSVLKQTPQDRVNSAYAPFEPCAACSAEYADPANRHFRAETIVCPRCGPQAALIRFDGRPVPFEQHSLLDDVDAACSVIQKGEIVAIKGLGGYQLACDATNGAAVARLRRAKQNEQAPLPLMARDLHVIARYCAISVEEELQLTSAQGPLVVLRALGADTLPEEVAPGLATRAFMLPTTGLHLLLMQRMSRPVVMTSANLAGAPQIIDDREVREKFGVAVRHALVHEQRVFNRVEESVIRVMGNRPRLLRRARGYTPVPLKMPPGLEGATNLIAVGSDSRAVFCVIRNGEAIPSPHYANINNAEDARIYQDSLCTYRSLFEHRVEAMIIDASAEGFSSNRARSYAERWNVGLIEVQHHHAHVASCLAENAHPVSAPPALGVVLDEPYQGEDGTLLGGEFLLADYRSCHSVGTLRPVLLPGGEEAVREPWRLLHAHIVAAMGWEAFTAEFRGLALWADLEAMPRAWLDSLIAAGAAPQTSSCALLFSAVAAALDIGREVQAYSDEAILRLEAIVDERALRDAAPDVLYPVALQKPERERPLCIDPSAMWRALLRDLAADAPPGVVSARFHRWLAASIAAMATELAQHGTGAARFTKVALSGSCFQNRVLFEETERLLRQQNFVVCSHALVPPHDGGLALGQAAVGAARFLNASSQR